jgi:hypothetical protein
MDKPVRGKVAKRKKVATVVGRGRAVLVVVALSRGGAKKRNQFTKERANQLAATAAVGRPTYSSELFRLIFCAISNESPLPPAAFFRLLALLPLSEC